MLEPYAVKVACTVLEGLGVGNDLRLLNNTVEKFVNRLQTRIAKAVRMGKWNLVKRLQYLLTQSHYAKLLATKKVNQNQGKRTAGVDGEIWSAPEAKMKAALSLTDKRYAAKPLKRVFH